MARKDAKTLRFKDSQRFAKVLDFSLLAPIWCHYEYNNQRYFREASYSFENSSRGEWEKFEQADPLLSQ